MSNNAAQKIEPKHVILEWDESGQVKITLESVTYDHLIVGAFYLTRLASQMVDNLMAQARPVRGGIERAASIPDNIARLERKR